MLGEETEWAELLIAFGPKPTSISAFASGFDAVPIDPSILGELAIGALRVAAINHAVSGYERLAPAKSVVELRLVTLSGTSSPDPSVTKVDRGTGGPRTWIPRLNLG